MSRRTTVTVGLRRVAYGAKDARGNRARTWGDVEDLVVSSYVIGASAEPVESGRTAVTSDASVHAFPGTEVGPHDRLVLAGDEYEVDGQPWTASANPFTQSRPGVVINLKRVTG